MNPLEPNFDPKESLDWSSQVSMSARFFKVSFRKMLDMLKLVNDLDHSLIAMKESEKSGDSFLSIVDAHERIASRMRFIEFRISFELGHSLPMLNGEEISHHQLARDLYAKGAITEERLGRALRGEPSEDLPAVFVAIEKMRMGQEPF